MPTYTFKDNNTGLTFEEFMGMNKREKYLKDNPHIHQVPVMFAFVGDHIMGVGPKQDGGMTENLQRIAENHPGSALADRYGSSKTKDQKTRAVMKKHGAI
jgi:hypothetical protein